MSKFPLTERSDAVLSAQLSEVDLAEQGTGVEGRHSVLALYLSVFVTGFVVLALETIAFRMVSPYFGNTIFSFTSVITVVLAGLSFGYLTGGMYADRGATRATFYRLIGVGGTISFLFYASVPIILDGIAVVTHSLVWGSLLGSLGAFFVPAWILGMVSPYAIKLAIVDRGITHAGQTAGALFAFSTFGSIAGSISTGFWLMPHVPLTWTVVGVSLFLVVWGGVGWIVHAPRWKARVAFVLVGVSFIGVAYGVYAQEKPVSLPFEGTIVHQEEGLYQTITVLDTVYRNQPSRVLVLDRGLSSGISLLTNQLVFDYAKYQALYRLYVPEPERALYIGGGSASLAHALYAENETSHIVVVDIEPSLPSISHTYFRVPESDRLVYVIDDARVYLSRTEVTFDFIFSDIFASLFSVPTHVMTEEFFTLVRERMSPDGVFMINIIGSLDPRAPSALLSVYNTINKVFTTTELFAVENPRSQELQNFVIVASNGATVSERLATTEDQGMKHRLLPLAGHLVDLSAFDLTQYRIYRDNLASLEADLGILLLRFERNELLGAQ